MWQRLHSKLIHGNAVRYIATPFGCGQLQDAALTLPELHHGISIGCQPLPPWLSQADICGCLVEVAHRLLHRA
ncbi:hypothetical protein EJ110_NYTH47442 [Nymphaea thermarum]|nr:hypothetical protein EJ110_NYTH47442 [Nymphaea thermarum]